ncbi:MAG: NADH:ubiquinone reductase (Na(+)-transporting) subunit F [Bacteroidales bacterium]|nr:NADH:ubiquinone reductase (Na(+)-transporting) subunit F [Bacteroidales bacterium]
MILGLSIAGTVLISIAVFVLVMTLLVVVLLYARQKLTPQGDVTLKINDRDMVVAPGSNLLSTLSNNGVFLPSACGGGGTCGMCRCQITEGGGSILPTETGFFTRREQHDNWRLGCQVKVREDMTIRVPEAVLGVKKWECEVVSNRNVATFIKEFVVKLPEGEDLNFRSGEYVQIYIPKYEVDYRTDIDVEDEYRPDWDKFDLWSLKANNDEETFRAYSMANYPAEKNLIILNIRIATPPMDKNRKWLKVPPGICSSYIFSRKPGDRVAISGPYGEFHIKHTDAEMVYVGGGAGMAPLRSHIFHLLKTEKSNRRISYWYGARSKREIFYEEEFLELEKKFPNFTFNIALSEPLPEDNWTGYTGFIHKVLLDNYLDKHKLPEEIEYYLCGPPVMNAAVLNMLDNLGVPPENIAFDDFGG